MPPDVDVRSLGPREVIGRAVDVLMRRDGVNREDAFELLVQRSSGSHKKVREVAGDIVARDEG